MPVRRRTWRSARDGRSMLVSGAECPMKTFWNQGCQTGKALKRDTDMVKLLIHCQNGASSVRAPRYFHHVRAETIFLRFPARSIHTLYRNRAAKKRQPGEIPASESLRAVCLIGRFRTGRRPPNVPAWMSPQVIRVQKESISRFRLPSGRRTWSTCPSFSSTVPGPKDRVWTWSPTSGAGPAVAGARHP